jgi:hypothetical protein
MHLIFADCPDGLYLGEVSVIVRVRQKIPAGFTGEILFRPPVGEDIAEFESGEVASLVVNLISLLSNFASAGYGVQVSNEIPESSLSWLPMQECLSDLQHLEGDTLIDKVSNKGELPVSHFRGLNINRTLCGEEVKPNYCSGDYINCPECIALYKHFKTLPGHFISKSLL